ncbi:MAG: DUF4331 domain-containing protein [Actinomycetota bacterium]
MSRIRTALAAGISALALGAGLFTGLAPNASIASSHREAPLVAADPQVDNTDLYAFRSPSRPGYVSFVSSWIPFEEPAGGPNFYLWAEHTNYDINIDNDGDARADLIYRYTFDTRYRNPDTFLYNTGQVTSLNDPDLNIYQTYDLARIDVDRHKRRTLLDNEKVVPSNVGAASMPDYRGLFNAGIDKNLGSSSWVGQSDDAFFLDLRVFDLLYGTDLSEAGDDTLHGFNVNTIALEVPRVRVRGPNDSVIGVWNTASRPSMRIQHADGTQTFSGRDVQVSRLGMPLVNEVVVPIGAKDYFNGSRPKDDEQFLAKVQDPELPRLINAVYPTFFPNVPDSDPGTPGIQRADLIQVFLTGVPGLNMPDGVEPAEMLRLNIDTPLCGRHGAPACSALGVLGGDVQGFPNGRRLSDDTIDIALRAVMGVLLADHDPAAETLGDGVDTNESPFLSHFPYVAYPHSGSDPSPHA